MRVLLITDWNPSRGGTEAYIAWLREGLRASGDEVRLLTSRAGSAGDGSADYVAFGSTRLAAQAFLQIVNPFAVARVREAVRAFRPEVAYVGTFAYHLSPAIFHALGRVPTVLGMSDYKCVCPTGLKLLPNGTLCTAPAGWVCCRAGCVSLPHWLRDRPRYALMRSGVRRADRVVACGDWLRRELGRNGISSETATCPVPSPGPGFHRAPAVTPQFVFCGRMEFEKGGALLLRAFARVRAEMPQARLRVVGRGAEIPRLKRLAAALGLDGAVTFPGWLDPAEVEGQLSDAWALVAPSLWAEPLGLVAIEAIVRGVPVIASASGGLAETVEHGVSGLLFPNGDEGALADRMLEIARRQVFPDHAVPPDVVARVAAAHDMGAHVERLRGVFSDAVRRGAR